MLCFQCKKGGKANLFEASRQHGSSSAPRTSYAFGHASTTAGPFPHLWASMSTGLWLPGSSSLIIPAFVARRREWLSRQLFWKSAVQVQLDCPITVCFKAKCIASLYPFDSLLSSPGQLRPILHLKQHFPGEAFLDPLTTGEPPTLCHLPSHGTL